MLFYCILLYIISVLLFGYALNNLYFLLLVNAFTTVNGKGKVLPYSLPSSGPGANLSVQAVNPQVTF